MSDDPNTPPLPDGLPPNTEHETTPYQNTASVASEDIDPKFEGLALEQIKNIVKGNGVKTDTVEMTEFKGATLNFLATTKLTPRTQIKDRTQAGKVPGPVQISSKQELQDLIKKEEHKITHQSDVIKRIQNAVLERKDKGFGLSGQMVMLPFLYKEFVLYEPCQTCKANGNIPCQRCQASGFETCPKCQGQGKTVCRHCNGSQFINTPQGRQSCNHCHGQGREVCHLCQSQGRIQCSICKTKRSIPCTVCNGQAWNSHISRVEIDAMSEFDYDRQNVEQKVGVMVEKLGPDLHKHAQIQAVQRENEKKDAKDKRDYVTIPYHVRLPHAEMSFTIKGQPYNALMFGHNALLTHVPNFLESLIGKGAQRLEEAAQEQGNINEKIKQAGRYKTIRHAILASAKLSTDKAIKKVKQANPHAISIEMIDRLVRNADAALKNATRKKRKQGLIFGLLSMIGLYAGYLLAPARTIITDFVPDPLHQAGLDLFIIAGGVFLALGIIQTTSQSAMSAALKGLVPDTKLKSFHSKTGKAGNMAYYLAIPLFLLLCEISIHVPENLSLASPWWFTEIRQAFGL